MTTDGRTYNPDNDWKWVILTLAIVIILGIWGRGHGTSDDDQYWDDRTADEQRSALDSY